MNATDTNFLLNQYRRYMHEFISLSVNVSLIEASFLSQVWEQREALAYLGRVMPLVPVPFQHMVHLVTLCGTFTPYQPQPIAAQQTPGT